MLKVNSQDGQSQVADWTEEEEEDARPQKTNARHETADGQHGPFMCYKGISKVTSD